MDPDSPRLTSSRGRSAGAGAATTNGVAIQDASASGHAGGRDRGQPLVGVATPAANANTTRPPPSATPSAVSRQQRHVQSTSRPAAGGIATSPRTVSSPVAAHCRTFPPPAQHPLQSPLPSQARSPSPTLSISSVARKPWSAYNHAYSFELYQRQPIAPIGQQQQHRLPLLPSSQLPDCSQSSFPFPIDDRSIATDPYQTQEHRHNGHGRGSTAIAETAELGSSINHQQRQRTKKEKEKRYPSIMPLGIWDTRDGKAPGTVTIMSNEKSSSTAAATAVQGSLSPENTLDPKLKYDRAGKRPILLVPQPTDDPNDPLNWPRWRRDIILVILCFMSVIASTLSPLLAANTFLLTVEFEFEYTFTDMALLTGYHLLAVGLAGFLFVATARVWGKRHLYLLGTLLIIASSAWGGATGLNYKSLLGARIVQGIGLAPFEALVNASVGDLYFVHERGARMALSNMALFGGAFFTPIIVGKMTETIGWQWSFYFIAIFSGVMFPFIFFFVPETTFPRPEGTIVDADSFGNPQVPDISAVAPTVGSFNGPMAGTASDPAQSVDSNEKELKGSSLDEEAKTTSTAPRQPPPKMPFRQTLLPFSGRKSNENMFKLMLRPIPLFLHPAVAWACLIQGALIGWTVLMGVVLAAIFITPPLLFSEVQTGYMYAGPFIGALVGFVLSGMLADWSTKLMIRANGGVYEPEFRIPLVLLQLVLGCSGLYGFGWTSSQVRYGGPGGWFWPDFCFALEVAGMVVGAVASALYIVDAHKEIAVEAFTCLLIFKNVFSFGLTYGAFDWLTPGIWPVFLILGSVQAGICALSIPMYIFGKRNRAFFARYDILKMLRLW